MTQETARETVDSVTDALSEYKDTDEFRALYALATGEKEASELDWEDWTYPVKLHPEVVLEVEACGVGVRWYDVLNDLIHVHTGGTGGWRQVLPGNLRGELNRAGSSGRVRVRPVLREEVPADD